MKADLHAVDDLINRLRIEGVQVVCCGGAARDTYLGRTPKDYDFVVLGDTSHGTLEDAISNATGYATRELGNDEEYVAEDRSLEHVYESAIISPLSTKLIPVQFLVYTPAKTKSFGGDPYNVVEDFDCSLNYAWFEQHVTPDEQHLLLVRVHPEFPSTQFAVPPTHRDGDADRKRYIKSKFPEFYKP